MTVLYVMSEYPSVTQTFVVNEAAAMVELGVPVVGYALRRGPTIRSAARVKLICPPPSRSQIWSATLRSLSDFIVDVWHNREQRLTPREYLRLLLSHANAAYAISHCRAAGITHVHAHFLGRTSDVAAALARRLGCEWTATAHASDVYAPTEPGLLRRRLGGVAAVACANQGVLEGVMGRGSPELRSAVIHCGVDTRVLRLSPYHSHRGFLHIVTVGRLVSTKGHWTILESAAALMQRDPELHWTVVGDGPIREQLTQDPRYLKLRPRLTYTGALDHAKILELVSKATLFALPCELGVRGESDGIPVALLEAMALGVPVVTTPIGGIPELIVSGENGYLVRPVDSRCLTKTIAQLLYESTPDELMRIRESARSSIVAGFDLMSEARKLRRMLRPYLGESGP